MSVTIALAGNPNSGKTTVFNALTGSSQYVGNWPGVTVEKKEGKYRQQKNVQIMDLPGIYSLSPYTLEEVVSRNYLVQERPDAIINIVDASNLERNLYLTTQLMELGIPVVIALNMIDVVRKRGDEIDVKALSKALGCPVIETSAVREEGIEQAANAAIEAAQQGREPRSVQFAQELERDLADISAALPDSLADNQRWYAVKLLERDEKVLAQIDLPRETLNQVDRIVQRAEERMDDDGESIVTNERYGYITALLDTCYRKKNKDKLTTSDKIDKIVTNRFLALPIFVVVMFAVYFIAVSTVGNFLTEFMEETVVEGWFMEPIGEWMEGIGAAEWLTGLVVDGVIAGVGAVLTFLPQMIVLFFLLALLEDCGYMSRIAFIMDRIFRRFGLSGKSFIPILIGTGCAVPGIMASRTIENERDRKMTIITTSFIPCGAKLPIIALIAGALFDGAWWVAPSAYFVGMAAIICSGIILKKFQAFAGDPAPFVMELPAYHAPRAKGVLLHTWDRAKSFVIRAGTIIFVSCAIVWFLQSFGFEDGSFGMVDVEDSILAWLGGGIAWLFSPLGFGNWRAVVATITGLVGNVIVEGARGVLGGGMEEIGAVGGGIWGLLGGYFTQLSAYAFLLFNLLCAPCFAAIGAIRREMGNWKWTLYAICYQTVFAYAVALCFFQLGSLFSGEGFNFGSFVAIVLVALFAYLLFRPYRKGRQGEKLPAQKEPALTR
ncbi:MAG: ferrous iron transport protein B [Clostridiales bacterium]|nr:ferrous iron transport protein B [Clostridiales bacterium]